MPTYRNLASAFLCLSFLAASAHLPALAQASFTARLQGNVLDPSGKSIGDAKVSIRNDATGTVERTVTDREGRYIFSSLQPGAYTISVEAPGFAPLTQPGIVLRVSQQSALDLTLTVAKSSTSIDVRDANVVLTSANGELGQEITGRYITEIPLANRQIEKLTFLAPGVTESQGFDADQTNENYASNGQRNSSAEIRLDGSILSVPEAGEGAMFWSHYQPSIEIVDQFKVQTNGFSAQYGSNGGTVVNIVTKSGTNQLHGSAYYFGQWSALNANNFFANRSGTPEPEYHRHQFGGTVGGPIVKNRLFYFFNLDQTIYNAPDTVTTSVPTALQRQGDFSQTLNANGSLEAIFNPYNTMPGTNASGGADVQRVPYPGNKIPASEINSIGANIVALFPMPTGPGNVNTGLNNFTKTYLLGQPAHQYNLKSDYITDAQRLSGRFSYGFLQRQSPTDFAGNIGQGNELNHYYNGVLDETWTLSPTTIWDTRIAVDRHHQTRLPIEQESPTALGFPSILETANGSTVLPTMSFTNYAGLGLTSYTQTIEAQTEWSLGSSVTKVLHGHTLQFGGESRMLLSNFFQPAYPSGSFKFNTASTAQFDLAPSSSQGNAIASLLAGWANSGSLTITPSVAETSHENALFFQDDWTHGRLTLNIGLRWEHSSPYTDRYNRLQIADFTAPSGVTVPGVGPITGVDQFVTSGQPTSNSEWRNFGPRLGFAYQINPRTVIRGGAGLYYGVNYATSYQDLGPSYLANLTYQPSLNNGLTPYSSLANPFPAGNVTAQGTQYGKLAAWGFSSTDNLSNTLRNAEIYQWALTVQRALPGNQMIEVAYSANRSTHLPDGGTRNRNYISTALRQEYGTSGLAKLVTNPFYSLFTGPNAIFNQPTSVYAQPTIPQVDLLRPYPQFPGDFDGYAEFVANSWYNALQVKYEKRFSRGLNIVASYTLASQNDDSDYTSNSYLGNAPSVQDLNNLRGEYSVGATDATNRLVFSGSYELPIGKGKQFGDNFNKTMDTLFGGWQINAYYTYQTGLPLNVTMKSSRITDGSQRPNVTGDPRSVYSIQQVVNGLGALNYFNVSAFSDPGDQIGGNEPRFNSALRGDSIRDIDASLFKNFTFWGRFKLQIRAEFFNFFNTVRFDDPNISFGNTSFGVISSQANNPRQAQMGARLVF